MMVKCTHLVKTTSLLEAFVTNMRMKFSMSPTFQLLQIVNPFVRTILSAISSHTQLVMKVKIKTIYFNLGHQSFIKHQISKM